MGQYGHTLVAVLSSTSAGLGITSICVTLAAPWRLAVPTQSAPVSPPPMTTTCLPLALIGFFASPATSWFCAISHSSAKYTPLSSRPGTGKSRGVSEPMESTTASNCSFNSSGEMNSCAVLATPLTNSLLPTVVLVLNVTPSAAICAMRRSMTCFSSLKSGIP